MLLQIKDNSLPSKKPTPFKTKAIGIDLGTTNSVATAIIDNQIVHLTDIIPSIVQYKNVQGKLQVIAGEKAKKSIKENCQDTVISVKSLMGKNYFDLQDNPKSKIYPLYQENDSPNIKLKVADHVMDPIQISADLLRHIKQKAEKRLATTINKAVITVPAYFDDAARNATQKAAQLANLEVIRLMNEPTAAAIAYGLDNAEQGIYGVYDLGGGTFDFSLLNMKLGVFQVIATSGDTNLGGDNFDQLLANYVINKYNFTINQERNIDFLQKIKILKEKLSTQQKSSIKLFNCHVTVTLQEFIALINPLIMRTLAICDEAISYKNVILSQLKGIILVGGSTKIPYISDCITKHYSCHIHQDNIDPDKIVATGAAIQAYNLTGGNFGNNDKAILLLDITPLSLGIEIMGGLMDVMIARNTPIPISYTQTFTTYQDGQTAILLHVLQGEREMAKDCRSLANFELREIPPMDAGVARINVTFTIDADGILTVSAEELTTKKKQKIIIKPTYGLDAEKLEQMIKNSLINAKNDIKIKRLTKTRLMGENIIKIVEKAIKTDKILLNTKDLKQIQAQISALKLAIPTEDHEHIEYLIDKIEKYADTFFYKRVNKYISNALKNKDIQLIKDIIK